MSHCSKQDASGILREEAAFADKEYEPRRNELALSAELFDELSPSDRADLRRLLETMLDTYTTVAAEPAELRN